MSNLTRCPICKGVALHRPRCTEEKFREAKERDRLLKKIRESAALAKNRGEP